MAQSEFVHVSEKELHSLSNSIKAVYELPSNPQIPPFPAGANLNQNIEISTNQIKNTYSGVLGFTGVNISANAEYEFYAMDIMKSRVIQGSIDGPVLSVTYGVGCRLILKIKKIKTEVDVVVPLSQLAAHTELGNLETSIGVQLKGFGADKLPDIPDNIFTFSKFDLEKFTRINQFINNIINFLEDTANNSFYEPVLIGVELKKIYSDDLEDILKNANYALWRIKNGTSLKDALKLAKDKGINLNDEIIRRVYAFIMQRPQLALAGAEQQTIGGNKPGKEEETRARDLLIKYRIVNKKDS